MGVKWGLAEGHRLSSFSDVPSVWLPKCIDVMDITTIQLGKLQRESETGKCFLIIMDGHNIKINCLARFDIAAF